MPTSDLIISALIFFAQISSWSIAAALNVSAAPNTTDLLLFLKNLPILPIVVVLPTPFTPEITITADLLLPRLSKFFSYFRRSRESFSAKSLRTSL